MKYTKSAIGLLNARYRSVLKKCLLINLGLFALGAVAVTPAMADVDDDGTNIMIIPEKSNGEIRFYSANDDGDPENLIARIDRVGNIFVREVIATNGLQSGDGDDFFWVDSANQKVNMGANIKASFQRVLEIPSSSVIGSQTTPWADGTPLAGKTIGKNDTSTDITIVGGLDLLNTAIKNNTDAIDILNGDESVEGSVAKAIADSFAGKTKLSDYGITNAYTRNQINTKLELKADIADLADVAFSGEAEDVSYDNSASGLTADNVQDAIDEVVGGLVMDADATSSAGYEEGDAVNSALADVDVALATAEGAIETLNGDETVDGSVANSIKTTAADADYDNTASGLSADTIAGAIDEIVGGIVMDADATSSAGYEEGDAVNSALAAVDDALATAEGAIDTLQGIVGDAQDTEATVGLLAGETIGDSISLVDAIDTVAQSAAGLDEDNTFTGSNTFEKAIIAEDGIDFGDSGFGIDGDGNATLNSLDVDGDAAVGGDLDVTGDISGADITASGSLIGNELAITTDASIGGDLDVTGGASVGGDLAVTGDISGADITASGSLIGNELAITTDASIGGDLDVTGGASVGGDLAVTGDISGADITASGSLIGNELAITTDASIGGDLGVGGKISGGTLNIADGKFKVNKNGGINAAGGNFKVNKHGGVTAAGGDFKIDKDGNTTISGDLEVAGDTTLADTFVGGDLSVIGTTILSDTNGLQFGDDGQNVTSIDDGSSALEDKDETQLATVATVLTSAENADYTASSSTGNITSGGTLKSAINELDVAIGNRIVKNNLGADYDYDSDPAVVTDALSKLASNIGSATTSDKGNIISSYTVNQNLDKIDTNIGDISTFASSTTGNLSNSVNPGADDNAKDIATAINNIDATLGKIHGLYKDGAVNVTPGGVESTVNGNSNLAEGTTVENHLVSLDNSVGDRTLVSANADINNAMRGTSVAAGLKAAGDKIGTADFSDTRYAVGANNVTDAIKKLDSNMARVEHDVRDLRHDFKTGMASMAAMTALVPNARGCGNTSLSLGTGAYDGHTAMALGAFHYLTDNVLLNAGVAWGNTSDAAYRMGITWSF